MELVSILNQFQDQTNKPSFLINCKRKGTLVSNKIYNKLLKVVLKNYNPEDTRAIFHISMEELKNCISAKRTNAQTVIDNIKLLQNTQIEYNNWYSKKDKNWASYQILGSTEYSKQTGILTYSMDTVFLDLLVKLKSEDNILFAKLEDETIKNLKYKHSIILYEFIKDNQYSNHFEISFENLRGLLDIENKYKSAKDLKKLLDKSLAEIEKESEISYSYKYSKMVITGKTLSDTKVDTHLVIDIKEHLYIQKGLLDFEEFKKIFSLFIQDKRLTFKDPLGDQQLTLNKGGYIVIKKTFEQLEPASAISVWQYIYNKIYLPTPEVIYRKCKTNQEMFELGETMYDEE